MARREASGITRPQAAEFFAGIGLMRTALQDSGFRVVFANDIEAAKRDLYVLNFGPRHFVLGDIREVNGSDVPEVELATASFPCTDLSLAGRRAGIHGKDSGMFWEFARVLKEMDDRRPFAVMLENVVGFATSHGGEDMKSAIEELNRLGYRCDMFVVDARWFVPQSRPRMFIVGSQGALSKSGTFEPSPLRPSWIQGFVNRNRSLKLQALPMHPPKPSGPILGEVVEKLHHTDRRWWDQERLSLFLDSLSSIQRARVERHRNALWKTWATAYRRTRHGSAVWEIRDDALSGCLRTARGGSSKQAVVEGGRGKLRVRWMTPREYARLQGVPDYDLGGVRDSQAYFGLGDAVCVPVVRWIARQYLLPLVQGRLTDDPRECLSA